MIISAQSFYSKYQKHSKKILLTVAFFWILLICLLAYLPIDKSSTAFFPDNTKSLQSMTRAMQGVSQDIYINFTILDSKEAISLEQTIGQIQKVVEKLNPTLITPINYATPPAPQDILQLLPSLFDKKMEQEFNHLLKQENIIDAMLNAQSILLGPPSATGVDWVRHDPLNLRQLIKIPDYNKITNVNIAPSSLGISTHADEKHFLVTLRPTKSIHDTDFALSVMKNIEFALNELSPQIKANIIGAIRHTVANTKAIDADILWISLVSLLGLALIYGIFIRSLGGLWLLLTPCLALSVALGMMHLFFGVVSGLAVGFGMSILGIAEDYAVHMHFALRSNNNKKLVFDALSTPLFQGFLLNASGFTLLLFSGIMAVRQLSAFSIITLFCGLILALYILPLCKGFDKPAMINPLPRQKNICLPHLKATLSLSLILGIICIGLFSLLPIDVAPQSMGADANIIQAQSKDFAKKWQIQSPSLVLIDAENSTKALEKTRSIQKALEKSMPQTQFISLADYLPSEAQVIENLARWNNFIVSNKNSIITSIVGFDAPYDTSLVFAPFFNFLEAKPLQLNIEILEQGPLGKLSQNLLQHYPKENISQSRIIAQPDLQANNIPTNIKEQITIFSPQNLEQNLRKAFFAQSSYLPLMIILGLVLLFICFKNIAQALLAALPSLVALVCIFLTMHLLQKPLTLASIAAMPLVLGLSIDHGIMATHHLAKGLSLQMNRAIIVSSLTACVSMGMLAFASHPTLQAMGHVVFVGLLVEMPTAIWLLPRLCKKIKT